MQYATHMMRIAFDATSALGQSGGIGRFTLGELRGLSFMDYVNQYEVLFPRNLLRVQKPVLTRNFHWRPLPFSEKESIWLWHRLRMPLAADFLLPGIDIYHAPDYTLPPLRNAKGIVTIHDLSFEAMKDVHHPKLRDYLRHAVPYSIQRADHVFADSQSTKDEVMRTYLTDEKKITVVYPGVEAKFRPYNVKAATDADRLAGVTDKYQITRPFVLTVGTLEPRKNISTVIRAFKQYRDMGGDPEMELLIAGGGGWLSEKEKLKAIVPQLELEGHVRFLGFVPDDELPVLINLARVIAYPSLYEGFGFPVLEALACGTPVVTARNTSLPEAGGNAAYYIEYARDDRALADALLKVAHDEDMRRRMRQQGLLHAAQFTWERTAQQVVKLYEQVLK